MEIRETYAAWKDRMVTEYHKVSLAVDYRDTVVISATAHAQSGVVGKWTPAVEPEAEPEDYTDTIRTSFQKRGFDVSVSPAHPVNQDMRRWLVSHESGQVYVEISGLEEMVNRTPEAKTDLLAARIGNAIRELSREAA